ncbi:MAG: ATP-binding protein, partial [bacterium]|nr:ATP-binding protein [bacterium]
RRRLWRSHLGDEHRLAPRDVNKLAATADLCGGHIRNVVLAAAVPARHHDRPIELADVLRGLAAEYRKLGRQLPAELKVET